jgi:magnesium transporter
MNDPDPQTDIQPKESTTLVTEPLTFDIDTEVVDALIMAREAGDHGMVHALCDALHASEVADVLEQISPAHRAELLASLGDKFDSETLAELDDNIREELIDHMGFASVA